ncbi:hypothetical protein M405DRAFT_830709 [Rhizopogon salebrosus TDB-379]|nr:hypothetical protein M405DRAFT_830709 [Rhizopogon salebrosus TDB-379]
MRLSAFGIPILSASTAFALSKSSRPYRRALVHDICGSLNTDLFLNEVIDNHGKATIAGHLDACLCLSDVVNFVQSDAVAQAAVKLLDDHVKVEAIISGMIKALPDSQCIYPDHARALCTDSNPCDFECTDGYLAFPADKPTSCTCPEHLMECDGKCGHFKDCPSKAPLSRRTNEPQCDPGRTMCGIAGTSTGKAWQCVDVNTEPTTCGGCTQKAPFGNAPVGGTNCKDIKGVNQDTVACGNGFCIVKDCLEGYVVAPGNDTCIPLPQSAAASSKGYASGTGESAEGLKASRDELTAGAVHAVALAEPPVVGAAKKLSGGAQASPAGALVEHGAKGITGGAKVVRDVGGGFSHGAKGANPVLVATGGVEAGVDAASKGLLADVKQGPGLKAVRGADPVSAAEGLTGGVKVTHTVGGLKHGAGAKGAKTVTGTTA